MPCVVLRYDTSCKVAIKFKTPWWIARCGITQGGTSLSDIPIRTCCYPSHSIHDDPNKPAVLIALYTMGQNAQRIVVLRDLACLHARSGITYEYLAAQYVTHHAYDWRKDPLSGGAFAIFALGQFRHLAHHAWVLGALESAQRAVILSLLRFGRRDLAKKVEERWGPTSELDWVGQKAAYVQAMLGRLEPKRAAKMETPESYDDPDEHHDVKDEKPGGSSTDESGSNKLSVRSGGCFIV
ncbi:hypothetical protein BDR07DRAFT_1431540 [Suillus spraguei]|nr:hypothetical protein BDR07DRAFT_1431540 [Suillus spraguei]